jgi:hypothetical protein
MLKDLIELRNPSISASAFGARALNDVEDADFDTTNMREFGESISSSLAQPSLQLIVITHDHRLVFIFN